MKTSIFKKTTSKPILNYSTSILLFCLLFNIKANSQNHCLVIKNIGINIAGGSQVPNCDGSFANGCQPGEFIELFNTCDTAQNFGCYIVCAGNWCVRIPANIPDLPPSGTIVLGSTFSPGFDINNPFHIDIHNCNNCSWDNVSIGNPLQNIGILSNVGGEITLYNSIGDLEMGVYWGSSSNSYQNLDVQFADACPNQNLSLPFPDPNGNQEFVDLGNLAAADGCAISIPCATIEDNSVSVAPPEALCTAEGENSAIGGSNPFTQIGPIDVGSACFYDQNTETFLAYYEPQNSSIQPQVTWSSSTGLMFESNTGDTVSSIITPLPDVIFTSAGNHTITMALQLPGDDCIYYYTEDLFVEESVDFSDLTACLGSDFTIEDAPPGTTVLVVLAIFDLNGAILTPPQNTLPATFFLPEILPAGTYIVRYVLESPYCTVDVPLEVLEAGECLLNCDDVAIVGLPEVVTNQSAVTLNATPAGGIFSGEGVLFNAFNPSLVSAGFNQITYTYTNGEGCVTTVSENILVTAISYNFVSYNLGVIAPKIIADFEVFENGYQPVSVADLNGQVLFETNKWLISGNQKFTIDVNDWSKGVYFVKVGQFSKPQKVYVY